MIRMSKKSVNAKIPSQTSSLVVLDSSRTVWREKHTTLAELDRSQSRDLHSTPEDRDSIVEVSNGASIESKNTPRKDIRVHRECKLFLVRIIVWSMALGFATFANFYFANLSGTVDTSQDAIVQYAQRASQNITLVVSYLVTVTIITTLFALATAVYVFRHYREPRLRALFPPFLLHICLASVIVPPVMLIRQLYSVYYLHLGRSTGLFVFAHFVQATTMGMVLYAPLARLCVMYAIFVRGRYDVKYGRVLLRIVLQNVLLHLCYLALFAPPSVHWISKVGWRVGLVCISAEILYYIVRLRNTRYGRENYSHLLYIVCFGLVVLIYIGTILPVLTPVSKELNQFNISILMLWCLNIEILGPPLWHVFKNHMDWRYTAVGSHISLTCTDVLRDTLANPVLSAILIQCAQQQFCEENTAFLQEGYQLQAALNGRSDKNGIIDTTLYRQIQTFLETFVVSGAKMPVNLSSAHLSKFRRIYSTLTSAEICNGEMVSLLETTLSESLLEISELIASSGVLTRYDNSRERKEIQSEMEAVKRLETQL